MSGILEPGGLNAVDFLIKIAMEEGILHIKMTNRLVVGESQRKHSPHDGRFDDGAKGFYKINTRALCEAAENPTSFIVLQ